MKQKNKMLTVFEIALMMAVMCGALGAQIQRTRPPNSTLAAPAPHAQQPVGGQHPVPTGTIYGFVYWDSKVTSHLSPSICSNLAITLVVANTKGSYTPFGVVGTQSHLTSIATVHPPLTSINTTSYDGCAYSYGSAPLGQKLYAKLSLTQSVGTLTSAIVAQDPAIGPIQFSSANCSKLPPLTKATVGELLGTWGSCQNDAYDVNFPLVKTGHLTTLSSSGGSSGNQSGSRGAVVLNPSSKQEPLLPNPGPTNAPLLKTQSPTSSPAGGMLVPAVKPSPTPAVSNPQPGTPGQLLPAKPGGGGEVQLNPQPYPPKGLNSPSRTMRATTEILRGAKERLINGQDSRQGVRILG